jgi:hypothetical protein
MDLTSLGLCALSEEQMETNFGPLQKQIADKIFRGFPHSFYPNAVNSF